MSALNEKDIRGLRTLWEKTGGKAWEPPAPNYPWLVRMIDAGFLRRCDMRCGFEAMKDAGVAWTDAGRLAIGAAFSLVEDAERLLEHYPHPQSVYASNARHSIAMLRGAGE